MNLKERPLEPPKMRWEEKVYPKCEECGQTLYGYCYKMNDDFLCHACFIDYITSEYIVDAENYVRYE